MTTELEKGCITLTDTYTEHGYMSVVVRDENNTETAAEHTVHILELMAAMEGFLSKYNREVERDYQLWRINSRAQPHMSDINN